MNPDDVELENLSKIFEYERISREIDSCEDIEQVKNIAKSFVKLHLKQQEVITQIGLIDGKTL
jgi:hypothetical protein